MLASLSFQRGPGFLVAAVAAAARRPAQAPLAPPPATSAALSRGAAAAAAAADPSPSPRPPLPATDSVTSPANPYVKHLAKLGGSASHRRASGAALIPGADLVAELGDGGRSSAARPHVFSLWLAPGHPAPAWARAAAVPTFTAPPAVLARIAGVESGTGVGAVAEVALPAAPAWWESGGSGAGAGVGGRGSPPAAPPPPAPPPSHLPRRLLALDGVQDPGNVGALARAAAALGWDGLVLLPGCADPWSAKAVRAARGAAGWRLPTAVVVGGSRGGGTTAVAPAAASSAAAVARLRSLADAAGLAVLAADAEHACDGAGRPTPTPAAAAAAAGPAVPPTSRGVCLVLGAEGAGLSPAARAAADAAVAIPMPGGLESLNVAQAGLLLLFALSEGGGLVGSVMERLYGGGGGRA